MTFLKQLLVVVILASGFVAASATYAQQGPSTASALDKKTLEDYLRHLFVWGPQIAVTIADPKPSELPGFLLVVVRASAGKAEVTQ